MHGDPIAQTPRPRRIGLFGGTFDPVHHGHLQLAALAQQALGLDEVRFIPCRISPHKAGGAAASGDDRLQMLRLATAPLEWAMVDDLELRRPGPSYSHETAAELARQTPGARFFWIMGGDQWDALPRWNQPERLAGLVEFIVIGRGASPTPREGFRLHAVAGGHPASATAIRQALRREPEDRPPADPWLPDAVAAYIRRRGLYRK